MHRYYGFLLKCSKVQPCGRVLSPKLYLHDEGTILLGFSLLIPQVPGSVALFHIIISPLEKSPLLTNPRSAPVWPNICISIIQSKYKVLKFTLKSGLYLLSPRSLGMSVRCSSSQVQVLPDNSSLTF